LAAKKIEIIYEDDNLVAINKPSGQLSIPDREQSERSLKEILQEKYGQIFTVHRLDKDTSGIVLFAKNAESHKYLCQLFEERKVKKIYSGIVMGRPEQETGDIEAPLAEHPLHKGTMHVHRKGKPAHTGYRILQSAASYSLVEFELFTGRTHQIRVHAKELGFPLACDPLYGDCKPVFLSTIKKKYNLGKFEEERPMINRLALHAHKLELTLSNGKLLTLQAALPKEFKALMQQLAKKS